MISKLFEKPKFKQDQNSLIRGLVSRYSQGSACLSLGRYLTKEDIQVRKDKVLAVRW